MNKWDLMFAAILAAILIGFMFKIDHDHKKSPDICIESGGSWKKMYNKIGNNYQQKCEFIKPQQKSGYYTIID